MEREKRDQGAKGEGQFFLVYLFRSDYGNGRTLDWSERILRKTEEEAIQNVTEILWNRSNTDFIDLYY